MKIKLLTPAEQIELLTKIKKQLTNISESDEISKYLCNIYFEVTTPSHNCWDEVYSIANRNRQKHFHKQVPLFTYANAKQFGASICPANCGGWWNCDEIELRVKFLDWLIEENQKLIK